jgi:hypothetical protein
VSTPQITLVNPALSIEPSSHDFGNTVVNQASAQRTFTITNISGHNLTVNTVSLTGVDHNQFILTVGGLPWTIEAEGSQAFTVLFYPTSVGEKSANITINHNANGSPTNVVLSGNGIPHVPILNITPTSHDYGIVALGQTATQTFLITNTGTANLIVGSIIKSGADQELFTLAATGLPWTIAAGGDRSFSVAFKPMSPGIKSAEFSVNHNAEGSSFPLQVTGMGSTDPIPIADISPLSHSFGNVIIGQTSAARTFTINNIGTAVLEINSINWVGSNQAQFTMTHTQLPWNIIPAGHQTFTVSFNPFMVGNYSEIIRINHNDISSLTDIIVSGIADPHPPTFSVNPTIYYFGSVIVGQTSAIRTFTITNSGGSTLVIQPISMGGASANEFRFESVNFAPVDVLPGNSFVFSVVFSPRTIGNKTANILIAHNAAGSPMSIPISGSGVIPIIHVDPTSHDFGVIDAFQTSPTKDFTIKNIGNTDLIISNITLTGLNQEEFDLLGLSDFPMSITAESYWSFTATFTPQSSGLKYAVINIIHNASGSQTTIMIEGEGGVSEADKVDIHDVTMLLGNFPNPFNPFTNIRYQVSGIERVAVIIEVFDIRGRLVRTLLDGSREFGAGNHSVEWDGRDDNGEAVSSGLYFYRMIAGEYVAVGRMLLMK